MNTKLLLILQNIKTQYKIKAMQYISELFIKQLNMSYAFLLKYIIIGDSGVGKSCLLLQYTDKRYRDKHQVTIGVQFGAKMIKMNQNNIKLQIWDTAGQESFKAITRGYYRNAIGAIVCYDVSNKQSFAHITRWLQQAKLNGPSCLNFILVGNKSDKQAQRKVTFQQGLRFAKQQGIPFIQTSAKNGTNVDEIFTILTQSVLNKIQSNSVQLKSHPGIKIGSEKYNPIHSQFNQKMQQTEQMIDIRKKPKKSSKCGCK